MSYTNFGVTLFFFTFTIEPRVLANEFWLLPEFVIDFGLVWPTSMVKKIGDASVYVMVITILIQKPVFFSLQLAVNVIISRN